MVRKLYILIILSVVFYIYGCKVNYEPIIKNLHYSEKAHNALKKHCEFYNYQYLVKKWGYLEDNNLVYDEEEYNALGELIKKHPDTPTALSAKLIQVQIKEDSPKVRPESKAICEYIVKRYPDTWQGIFAKYWIGHIMFSDSKSESTIGEVISYHLENFEKYKKLDDEKDPEFELVNKRLDQFENKKRNSIFSASVLSSIAYWYSFYIKDYTNGGNFYKRIIKEYPDSYEAKKAYFFLERFYKEDNNNR